MRPFLLVLAAVFGLYETAYFGWNMAPASPQELICDGITLVLAAIAFNSRRRVTDVSHLNELEKTMTIQVQGHVYRVTSSDAPRNHVCVHVMFDHNKIRANYNECVIFVIPKSDAAHWLVGRAVNLTVYAYSLPHNTQPIPEIETTMSDTTNAELLDPDDCPCIRCGKDALDTGWECTECGMDCRDFYYPQHKIMRELKTGAADHE